MEKLLNKIIIGNEYVEFEHKGKYVIIAVESGNSVVLEKEEFELFKQICTLANNREKLTDVASEDGKYKKTILKLIERGIMWIKELNSAKEYEIRRFSAYWGITQKCNFHCLYCYANAGEIDVNSQKEEGLSLEECFRVVDEVKKIGFFELVLTGGEPLLNKNVFEIAKYAKSKGLMVGLLTNGSLVKNENIEEFKIFDYVKISLDSYDSEANDKLRGKGSFDRITEGIRLLRDNGINVTIGSVLTKYNCDSVDRTIEYVNKEFGVTDHQIINHIPLGRGAEDGLGCDFDELKEYDRKILDAKMRLYENKFFSMIQDGFLIDGRKVSCGMGKSEIFIDAKGNVYPCRMTYSDEYYLGNVISEDLEVVLSRVDDKVADLHVDSLEDCKDCSFRYLCGGGCRMYHAGYSNSIYKNSQEVCETLKAQCKNLVLLKNNINPIE